MICDRVTIINRGKVVTSNTPNNLQAQLESSSGYEVEVGGNVDRILPLLSKIAGVVRVTVAESSLNKHPRHLLQISCANNTEPGKEIATAIVQQSLDLHEMRRTRPTLEDVFLELTTEEKLFS